MRMRNGRPASATSTSPLRSDVLHVLPNSPVTCAGVGRRRDGRDRARLRNRLRGGEHGGAAEAVADQDRGRLICFPQVIGRRHQVADVRRERRVGELAFARAEAGEIEAQHGDAARAVRPSAMRVAASTSLPQVKQCANSANATRRSGRAIEQGGKFFAARIREFEAFERHCILPNSSARLPAICSG